MAPWLRPFYFIDEQEMKERILEEAKRLFVQMEPGPAISEYEREQRAKRATHQRLKAERLARESERDRG
jgi:hypothetical protein